MTDHLRSRAYAPVTSAVEDQPEAAISTIEMTDGRFVGEGDEALRPWRNAWLLSGEVVSVDMAAAREILRANLRRQRTGLVEPYDDAIRLLGRKALLGALSAKDQEAVEQAERACQTLRNITADPRIEAAQTPEDLAALTVSVLVAD
jgi:hypothetical protein